MTRPCAFCGQPILEGEAAHARFDGQLVHTNRKHCQTTREEARLQAIKRRRFGRFTHKKGP